MADDKTAVRPIDVGGIKFGEIQANSWDNLLRTYQEWFSPRPESFKPGGPRPTQWVFRAEKRKRGEQAKDIDCVSCCCGNASLCRSADVGFLTSLTKAFMASGIDSPEEKEKWEADLVREFKRKAHHFEASLPDTEDDLEWLALIQHYFGPTRLLDRTYSFFLACYFAINELECGKSPPDERQIWALDANYITYEGEEPKRPRIERIIGKRRYHWCKKKAKRQAHNRFMDEDCALRGQVVDFLMRKNKACVYHVTPVRLNERLMKQRGAFLLQGDTTKCFVRNLKETLGNDHDSASYLYRIVISLSLTEKKRCLWELDHMGINQAVLFPDLRGFAESLIRRLAFRERRVPK